MPAGHAGPLGSGSDTILAVMLFIGSPSTSVLSPSKHASFDKLRTLGLLRGAAGLGADV